MSFKPWGKKRSGTQGPPLPVSSQLLECLGQEDAKSLQSLSLSPSPERGLVPVPGAVLRQNAVACIKRLKLTPSTGGPCHEGRAPAALEPKCKDVHRMLDNLTHYSTTHGPPGSPKGNSQDWMKFTSPRTRKFCHVSRSKLARGS